MNRATGDGGQSLTVHQLLRLLTPDYLERFGSSMPQRHRQVLRKILSCRTPALGGQLFQCPDCPGFAYRYHSCNNRHCPQCGQTDADEWLQRQQSRLLLPAPYFLLTFTVPQELRLFIRANPSIALDLLFAASAQALHNLAANPRRMGAQLGMLGVLHTWSRTLVFHPHVHYLIPGGGLSPDGRRWVPANNNYLLSHKALGDHFRTVFHERLRQGHPELFAQVPTPVWKRHWNVGCQAAGSGENALRYLSRYVFKTATSNRTIQRLPDGKVRGTIARAKPGGTPQSSWNRWNGCAAFYSTSCRRILRACAPSAGCIRRPKSVPTVCGPCCVNIHCSARRNRKPGSRPPNPKRSNRTHPPRLEAAGHCVQGVNKP